LSTVYAFVGLVHLPQGTPVIFLTTLTSPCIKHAVSFLCSSNWIFIIYYEFKAWKGWQHCFSF